MAKFTCLDCENRYVGCHSVCEKYIHEKEVHVELMHKYREEYGVEKYLTDRRIKEANKNAIRNKKYRHKVRRNSF